LVKQKDEKIVSLKESLESAKSELVKCRK